MPSMIEIIRNKPEIFPLLKHVASSALRLLQSQFRVWSVALHRLERTLVSHGGICGSDHGGDLRWLCVDNELMAYIKRITSGFEINPETLGEDVIRTMQPGGSFWRRNIRSATCATNSGFPAPPGPVILTMRGAVHTVGLLTISIPKRSYRSTIPVRLTRVVPVKLTKL